MKKNKFNIDEIWIIFIAYLGLLFILTFGFDILWTLWEALITNF